jgi:HEAT repeat protein
LQEYFRLTAMRRQNAAQGGFRALGPAAAPAIPELVRILVAHTNIAWGGMAWTAQRVLRDIGEPAWPQVIRLLDSSNSQQRRAMFPVFDARSLLAPQYAYQATRALVHCGGDEDGAVARSAMKQLSVASMAEAPCRDLALSALTNALADPRDSIRLEALTSLIRFGPELDAAAPALKPLVDDPNPEVRDLATNVWSIVQPDGLANAPKPAAEGN